MNNKLIFTGVMLVCFLTTTSAPVFAETGKDTARIEKLEERTRDLEARMAKVEASSQQQASKMMEHGMMGKGMGMKGAMGQMPQSVPPQDAGAPGGAMGGSMPQGGAPQPQGGGMPAGGMGDM